MPLAPVRFCGKGLRPETDGRWHDRRQLSNCLIGTGPAQVETHIQDHLTRVTRAPAGDPFQVRAGRSPPSSASIRLFPLAPPRSRMYSVRIGNGISIPSAP